MGGLRVTPQRYPQPLLTAETASIPAKLSTVREIRVMHPALADTLVGQSVDVLKQQQPNHKSGLNPGPAFVAVQRRDLAVDPLPFDLACKQH